MEFPSSIYLNAAIQLSVEPLKLALAVEAKAWKTAYGRGLNDHYRASMEKTVQFVKDYGKKLARPIKVHTVVLTYMMCNCITILQDLEDVRNMMQALDELRMSEIELDMEMSPVEECYGFLQRCGITVPREEVERVDSLRYTFKNLQAQAHQVQDGLVTLQGEFKTKLLDSVEIFTTDLESFCTSYNKVATRYVLAN